MLLAMGGLIFWKMSGDKTPETQAPPPPKLAEKKPVFEEPPPPPPPIEETKDAEAEKEEPKKITRVSNAPTACSDPCKGTVRFSSVPPGTRELSLSAAVGDEMRSAACSAEVRPGLSSTADCSAE
jgi:hypothetical protein